MSGICFAALNESSLLLAWVEEEDALYERNVLKLMAAGKVGALCLLNSLLRLLTEFVMNVLNGICYNTFSE